MGYVLAKDEPFRCVLFLIPMPLRFGRPSIRNNVLATFLDEAGRLRAFVPPFRFTSFFSPEDTLLCMVASEAALHAIGHKPDEMRIAELTTGSGLVGLHIAMTEGESRLLGLDVDPSAVNVAIGNARLLGLAGRSKFECADIWSDSTVASLTEYEPHLIICNPPYVPEPQDGALELEAGAGCDGTAHLMRTIEIAGAIRPSAIALSWCSLCDPGAIVREAGKAGYSLNSLFVVAIADGEYSGSVHQYLRSLSHSYIGESEETVAAVAPDGSGRFAYLLLAGDFSRTARNHSVEETAVAVQRICEDFSTRGLEALAQPIASVPVKSWILDRWDELRLRAFLHGERDLPKYMSA